MTNEKKEGSFMTLFVVMTISLLIAFLWNQIPIVKNTVNLVLSPTAGWLLSYNINWGMILIVFFITLFTTLIQKYATDQETLKEIKEEQKRLSEEAKKFSNDPQKMMEFNKKVLPLSMQAFRISMNSMAYTAIPLILFFRWFMEYFEALGNFKFFGFFTWFWFYLIVTIIFSSILRKVLKVA